MQRGIVWVVDDDSSIRWVLERALAGAGLTCTTFENGAEVLEALASKTPDVLLSDIRMPGMDGLELMSKVRDILPFTVFIILTNYAEFSYAKQAISLGAREYILKSEMRSSDIQRIVAEIAATTAKIRSEKVLAMLDGPRCSTSSRWRRP